MIPDLNSLLPPDTVTRDAATLEFTFDFAGGDLVFNYIFASTEYSFANDPFGRFNDIFGFFLDGPSINGNIALTDTIPYISVDNTLGSLDPDPNDILFSGFTTMLTATATNLAAGTYTAKIGITDVSDGLFDSGVFILSNSFSDGPVPVPVPFSALLFASGLFGLAGTKRNFKKKLD